MPRLVTIPDAPAGEGASGGVRVDLRPGPANASTAPLVLIGGMTQTLASWGGQIRPLSGNRTVVAYETRGQGTTTLSLADTSYPRHVADLNHLLDALELPGPVDLCGFSFGGRIALATAARFPARVRRLVLTGVGLEWDARAYAILQGWQACLATGDLEALGWVSLPAILGPDYLERNRAMLEPMVRAVASRNDFAAIKALSSATTHGADPEMTPAALAGAVRCPALVLGGELDPLATPPQVEALAAALGGESTVFPGLGHTLPIEAPEPWRERVLAFLRQD